MTQPVSEDIQRQMIAKARELMELQTKLMTPVAPDGVDLEMSIWSGCVSDLMLLADDEGRDTEFIIQMVGFAVGMFCAESSDPDAVLSGFVAASMVVMTHAIESGVEYIPKDVH